MKDLIIKELEKVTSLKKEDIEKLIETPPSLDLGDYSFPCFSLAKEMKKNPVQIAQDLSKKISLKEFEKIEAKGPYLNFFLNKNKISDSILSEIQKKKDKYGSSKSKKSKVMLEFSQPNTHKAFHVGHIRGTSLGESLARTLEFLGNEVIRANYSGDTGMHIAKWLWCYENYHKDEPLIDNEDWIAGIYVDAVKRLSENEDLQKDVDEINRKIETKEDKRINALWLKTRSLSIKSWGKIYKQLGTHFDIHFFESEVELSGKEAAEDLLKKGIAKRSDEAVIMDLEEYGLGVWVLLRKDGTVLYSAKDIALAKKKMKEFPADNYLVILGDEQKMHFQQLLKTLELMGINKNNAYSFLTFGMVRLPTGKMSSRTGDNILYSDFIKEVISYSQSEIEKREKLDKKDLEDRALKIAIAAIKYSMLKQSPKNVIVFNKEEALNFEGNTGPYLLYSYARARSILRKAKYKSSNLKSSKISDKEKELLVALGKFPGVVQHAANNLSPNLIANYAFDISQKFNEFYHSEQVIGSEDEKFKLAIVDCFSQVLRNALNLLGIETLEKM